MSVEEYSEASRSQWGGSAEEWARAAEEPDSGASAAAGEWMLATADLQPGESVLELACGAGRVGLEAASRVGPTGHVVCSDFAPEMVAAVRGRIERLELPCVEARVLDAEQLELDEGESYDVVLCRFGYMLMSDRSRAFSETARALRPGGRVVLAVWGGAEDNPWLATILSALLDHFEAPAPQPGTPGPFALGDRAHLSSLLADAGFDDVSVEEIASEQPYDSPEAWWERILTIGGPLKAALASVSESDREAIRQRALAGATPYVRPDGSVIFPASVLGARASR